MFHIHRSENLQCKAMHVTSILAGRRAEIDCTRVARVNSRVFCVKPRFRSLAEGPGLSCAAMQLKAGTLD
jgi:hypothetical protein